MQPRLPTPETDGLSTDASRRFVLIPVSEQVENQEPCEVDGINSRPTSEVESGNDEELVEEFVTRDRAYSSVSQFTQSDLSRLGMLTAIADAGSALGSSVLLSSPSYLNISHEVAKATALGEGAEATSMEYLDTILENAEYIDTVQGKLPLAEAARMIAKDRSKHPELFNKFYIRKVRMDCYKKLVCIGFSFLCLFGSFFTLRNLQSSNSGDDPSLGLITFGCLTSLMWFGGLVSSPILSRIRPKWTLVVASLPFLLYPMANFYPKSYTLIPCALFAGCGVGMLWNSEGVYMINLAATYALASRRPLIEVIGKFNGLIFTMYQCSHFVGNLLSSIILSEDINWFPNADNADEHTRIVKDTISNLTSMNISYQPSNASMYTTMTTIDPSLLDVYPSLLDVCGLEFYSSGQTSLSTRKVDPRQNWILLAILTALAFIGFLNLCIFLQPLKTLRTTGNNSIIDNLKSFLKMFTNPRVLLLIPYMAYPGLSGSLAMADYTKAYITCSYGVGYIGYILVAGACFSITGAFVSGRVIYKTGRIPVFLVGTLVSTGSLLNMLFWKPSVGNLEPIAFIPVCLWCLGDGIILSQINGFLGELFRTELVFALSVLHGCFGLGSALGTLTSAFSWLSLEHKLYVVISESWLAFILLICLEILRKKKIL